MAAPSLEEDPLLFYGDKSLFDDGKLASCDEVES